MDQFCTKCGYKLTLLFQFYHCDRCDGLVKNVVSTSVLWAAVERDMLQKLLDGESEMIRTYCVCFNKKDAEDMYSMKVLAGRITGDMSVVMTQRVYTDADISNEALNFTGIMYYDKIFYLRKSWNLYVPSEKMYPYCLWTSDDSIEDALERP